MDPTAYDRWLALETTHFWRVERRALLLELLEQHLPPEPEGRPRRLLDVGGASSLISREMRRFGEVTVVEPDAGSVELGRELGLDIRVGSLPDDLPVEGDFDAITLFDVIEHVDDDVAALRAVRDRMRPGALLLLTVPAVPLLFSDHDVSVHHRRRYLAGSLRAAIEGAGLRADWMSYFTSLLFPVVATQRLLSKARGVRARATYDVKVPSAPLNRAMQAVMRLERSALRRVRMPIGSSLVAACARAEDPPVRGTSRFGS